MADLEVFRKAEERESQLIPIKKQEEPVDFFERVQEPGAKFLSENPHPKGEKAWKYASYWRKIIPDLHKAYSGICAYTCHWIPQDTGNATVDHFKPKDKYPQDAYLWDNYRLACGRMNARKNQHEDIPDPFTLKEGTFEISFPTLQVIPGQGLSLSDEKSIKKVIDKRLQLNDQLCIDARKNWLKKYIRQDDLSFLEENAPFLAYELKRQHLDDVNHLMWEEYHR